jgi:hypothetical protein
MAVLLKCLGDGAGHEWVLYMQGHEWVLYMQGHEWVLYMQGHEWVLYMQGHEWVLHLQDGRFRWSRFENLLQEGSKSADFDPTQLWLLVEWLLTPQAGGVRERLGEEVARLVDAYVAADVRQQLQGR